MLNKNDCLFLIIDIQEKLVKMLEETDIVKNVTILVKSCDVLNIPTIITEQYPKGLGSTIDEIKSVSNATYFEKTAFSAIKDEKILKEIENKNKKQIIICGIEAHICVLQTALELKEKGYEIYFVNDCSASRKSSDFQTAVEYLKQEDIRIVSKEIVLFSLLETSRHPNFKELQQLVK